MSNEVEQRVTDDTLWHDEYCKQAKAARRPLEREITNLSHSLEFLMSLTGKCNATPIDRIPAGQARLIGFILDRRWQDGQRAFIAKLEYSPLGWPEETGPPDSRPTCIVSPKDPAARFGRAEAERLHIMLNSRKAGEVLVSECSVTVTHISPILPTAELNVLWAEVIDATSLDGPAVIVQPLGASRREFL